ncbi:flagellar basal body-associated protein FliL [Photobacterium damselae]|uniref:flagellar basal body-associated protein FliL n=1 Tax=Photobacterium damselae TaxID=38293 RepID=UPI00083AC29D|nr:flagellar basal body-associated protein FliL [Photobacterium damselae]KAB1509899.1 flagellar basal body-associated protein FliL [Photobacterium damselae subsp. damselae]ODA25976.1 flagellar basal body-associated protein FliL [Photobacterium damselae subsp. damselae]TLS69435.1 flagellar basal body-associated protein FliL [Photobacterium damselae subsp. damselae]
MANGKKKLFIILGVITLLAAGGCTAWFAFGNQESDVEHQQQEKGAKIESPIYYVVMPQPFTFNVTGDPRDRVVQIRVQLMVRGTGNETLTNQNIPLLESTLLQNFSAATVEDLRTAHGRTELRQRALSAVQSTMEKVTGVPAVERVLFTGFVMQ